MALAPLATAEDLSAWGIDVTDEDAVAVVLAAASSSVREAAGCAITRQQSTVTLWTEASRRIELPARPVHGVSSVVLDGVALSEGDGYVLRGSSLWRVAGQWQQSWEVPRDLEVSFEHGFDEVPADVVALVCSLAGAGMAAIADGYASRAGVQYESIDDYRIGYTTGPDAVASVMELPARTVRSLRKRFGTQSLVVGTIR